MPVIANAFQAASDAVEEVKRIVNAGDPAANTLNKIRHAVTPVTTSKCASRTVNVDVNSLGLCLLAWAFARGQEAHPCAFSVIADD